MGFPNLPGIPPLAGGLAGAVTLASPLTASLLDLLKPAWGIFPASDLTGKTPAIKPDSFLSIIYHNESNLPSFPIEQGAFDTYNKVSTPYDVTIRIAKSNTIGVGLGIGADKMVDFLKTLEKMLNDTNLYNIITPDATYINANLKGFDYKREMNNGAGIIIADLHFVEIMQAVVTKSAASSTTVLPDATATTPSAQSVIQSGSIAAQQVVSSTAQNYMNVAQQQISLGNLPAGAL